MQGTLFGVGDVFKARKNKCPCESLWIRIFYIDELRQMIFMRGIWLIAISLNQHDMYKSSLAFQALVTWPQNIELHSQKINQINTTTKQRHKQTTCPSLDTLSNPSSSQNPYRETFVLSLVIWSIYFKLQLIKKRALRQCQEIYFLCFWARKSENSW